MARKFIYNYSFTPSTQTIKIGGYVPKEKILMITNIDTGEIMLQFASPTEGLVSYSWDETATDLFSVDGVTTIVLEHPCTNMVSTQKLQIIVEENTIRTKPWDFGTDAIERMRIAHPQSLIDADFEYGLQSTKWQGYTSVNFIPAIYELIGQDVSVSNVVTNNTSPYSTITVTANAHGLSNGQAITISGLQNAPPTAARAEGSFLIRTVDANTFLYIAKGYVGPSNNSVLNTPYTLVRKAAFYSTASIPFDTMVSDGASPSIITVSCPRPHGLVPGHTLTIDISSAGTNHLLAEGNFFVESIPTQNSFTFTALTGGAVSNAVALTGSIFNRSDAFNIHRPFDGGVLIGPDSPAHGSRVVRQSKKYFRYQSGKGILWTSGTLLRPVFDIESVSASGNTIGSAITVSTEQVHGLQQGAVVKIDGITSTGFNGEYTVNNIISEKSFTVTAQVALGIVGANTALVDVQPKITSVSWHGSAVRAGLFDDQNGLFWESDGQKVYAVKRTSTFQMSGTVSVSNNSTAVTGTGTRFRDQVKAGDRVVIRGQSRLVSSVANNTSMFISPAFRLAGGASSITGAKIAKVTEQRIPQEKFNFDKLDGTGDSGYTIDLNKMQMLGVQYSWYGAGFADFILRGRDGNMITAHRFKNNNINTEAYMRTGNLPARYDIENDTSRTHLSANITSSQNTVSVANTYTFPNSGTLMIDNEMISYTGKSNANNTFTGCVRSANLVQFTGGSSRSFTAGTANAHDEGTGVILISCTCSPTLSHWGSSVIMDGGFDLDRGYFFNYARTNFTITANTTSTAFLIRLAPTVSDSIPGDLGQKELINRSQILLEKLEIISDRNMLVSGILNPANTSSITWTNLNTTAFGSQPSFTQISQTFTGVAAPGEQILSTIVSSAGGLSTVDLKTLKELTNSVIGGNGIYPDGPDVLAINLRNLAASGSATVQVNLFWSETQA